MMLCGGNYTSGPPVNKECTLRRIAMRHLPADRPPKSVAY